MGNYHRLWYWCGGLLVVLIMSCDSNSTTEANVDLPVRVDTFIVIKTDTFEKLVTDTLVGKCYPEHEWNITLCKPIPDHWPDSIVWRDGS